MQAALANRAAVEVCCCPNPGFRFAAPRGSRVTPKAGRLKRAVGAQKITCRGATRAFRPGLWLNPAFGRRSWFVRVTRKQSPRGQSYSPVPHRGRARVLLLLMENRAAV